MTPLADFFMLSKEQLLQKADKLRQEGKHDKAAELLASGLKNNAEDYELLLALASAHIACRKARDAVQALKNAISLAPAKTADVLATAERFYFTEEHSPELGDMVFEMNLSRRNIETAVKALKEMAEKDVDILISRYTKVRDSIEAYAGPAKPAGLLAKDMSVYYAMALLYERRNKAAQAMDFLDMILAKSPSEEQSVIEAALRVAGPHVTKPAVAVKYGDILFAAGKFDTALDLYGQAAGAGASSDVIDRLEKLIQAKENLGAINLLSQLYIQSQAPDKALPLVRRAAQLDKKHPETYIGQLREIVKIADSVDANLAVGDAAMEREKYDLALSSYGRVMELEPSRLQEILGRYQEILNKSPGNFEAATRIIDAYIAAGQTDQVIRSLKEIIKNDATLIDLALEKLDDLLKKQLDQPVALEFLGQCYMVRKEKGKAVKVFQYLATLGPEQNQAALAAIQKLAADDPSDPGPMLSMLSMLVRNRQLGESAMLGLELAKRQSAMWADFLPLLESAMPDADEAYLRQLLEICETLTAAGQSKPAIEFVRACALIVLKQYPEACALFSKLHKDPEISRLARETLLAYAQQFPEAGTIHLTVADMAQQDNDPAQMATSLLAAAKADQSLLPQVSNKLQDLLKLTPDNLDLQLIQMELLFQQNYLEKAFEQASQIVVRWPGAEGAKAHLRLGQVYVEKGELTKAAASLLKAVELDASLSQPAGDAIRKLIDIDATSLAGRYAMARIGIILKKFEEAVADLMAVISRDPRWAEKVLPDLKQVIALDPANFKALLAEAKIDIILGRNDDAVTALSAALDISPAANEQIVGVYKQLLERNSNQPRVRLAMAKAYIARGAIVNAVKLIEEAIIADEGLSEPAIRLLRLAQDKDTSDASSRYLLAKLYGQRGSFDQSIKLLREVMAERPQEIDNVAAELQAIVKQQPGNPEARYLLADIFTQGNRPDKAVAEYQQIIVSSPAEQQTVVDHLNAILTSNPGQIDALLLRSHTLAAAGDNKTAMEGFIRACELDPNLRQPVAAEIEKMRAAKPDMPEAFEALGMIYFESGKFTLARDMLAKAVDMITDPERRIRAGFYLAESYLALRDEVRAEEVMNRIRQTMPDASEVHKAMRRFATRRLQVEIDKAYQAVQESPDDEFRKIDLANKLLAIEKFDAVVNLLAFKPQDKEIANRRILLLGRAFLGRREAYTAVELLRQVPLDERPLNRFQLEVCYLLGQCYEAIGNFSAAVAAFRTVYMDQTDFKDVKRKLEHNAEKAVLKALGHKATMLEAVV
ncbi:MAG: tetratricopeptide repeat protein [Candidatus Edwardsbacteria bacterium]|nr:tetratricopeptide repeat protein [Candidatus Edwardsbacteria bacterium]